MYSLCLSLEPGYSHTEFMFIYLLGLFARDSLTETNWDEQPAQFVRSFLFPTWVFKQYI